MRTTGSAARARSVRLLGLAVVVALATALAPASLGGAAPPTAGAPTFTARGSVNQVDVLDAPAGASVELRRGNDLVTSTTIDSLGSYLFRNVDAGRYSVTVRAGSVSATQWVRVMSAREVPPPSLYRGQQLSVGNLGPTSGYGYLRTRDGTTLSTQVVLPGPPDKGPYPTVVEYSGYDPSSPSTSQPQFKLLMPLLGYAWVGVNLRGTGCSGGAFNFFDTLQDLDGYDAIETVAAQPWSTGRVGMVGISYAGIAQLFTAQTRPPHLAAITPLSVIDDTYRGILYPGGIFNDGFALSWATERQQQNKWPNPNAPAWVKQRIAGGDTECAHNMLLRGQNEDLLKEIQTHPYDAKFDPAHRYDYPEGGDSLAPLSFVRRIRAATFIVGAWQDEQTGGHWADMLGNFSRTTKLRVVGQNGVHTESLDPYVLREMLEFLDFYVAQRIPSIPASVRGLAPVIWQAITGVSVQLPPDRFTQYHDFGSALRAFEAEKPVRILWETGGRPGAVPGSPLPTAESSYSQWPPAETSDTAWYLQPGARLTGIRPGPDGGADSFHPDPSARPRTDYSGPSNGIWLANPAYDWTPAGDGTSLSYATAPLPAPLAMIGTASVDVWIRSSAPDTDLQVTISEIRPDGTERYVQNGWLRASHRKLDPGTSTVDDPHHTDLQRDAKPLPPGELTKVRIQVFPFAYVFRAGTRIRLTIEAPGGDRPLWTFSTLPTDGVTNTVAHDANHPSRVVLPLVLTVMGLPDTPAPCPSLRAQPCRAYVAPRTG